MMNNSGAFHRLYSEGAKKLFTASWKLNSSIQGTFNLRLGETGSHGTHTRWPHGGARASNVTVRDRSSVRGRWNADDHDTSHRQFWLSGAPRATHGPESLALCGWFAVSRPVCSVLWRVPDKYHSIFRNQNGTAAAHTIV
jgi:hypothetical protein